MVLLIKISWKYDQPRISTSISVNGYCIIYWRKTCFLAKFWPQKMEKWNFLKKIQKMISETIDSVNKIYFLTQIHCWMSGNILWNLILAQPGCGDNKNKPKNNIKNKSKNKNQKPVPRIKSVLFVLRTEKAELLKQLRSEEAKLSEFTGYRVKLVERSGIQLRRILCRTNPFAGQHCSRE